MTTLLIDIPGTGINAAEAIIMIGAISAAAYGTIKLFKELWKFGPKQTWARFNTWWKDRRTRRVMWNTLLDDLGDIKKELRTNGGTSLKDLVMTIATNTEHLQARVRSHDDMSTVPIFEMDGDGNMTYANTAFRDLIGADEKDMTFKNFYSLVKNSDRGRLEDEINRSIRLKAPIDSTADFLFDGRGFITIRLMAPPNVKTGGTLEGYFGRATPAPTSPDGSHYPPDCPLLPTIQE